MKKYIHLIPLIIYPYAYLIYFMVKFTVNDISTKMSDFMTNTLIITFIGFTLLALMCATLSIVYTLKGKYSVCDATKMNLIVKSIHIPAYIFHFIMFIYGVLIGIWGIAFVMIALIVDLLTISLTGINAISCAIGLKKQGLISSKKAIIGVWASFVFCLDFIVAIIYLKDCKKLSINKV